MVSHKCMAQVTKADAQGAEEVAVWNCVRLLSGKAVSAGLMGQEDANKVPGYHTSPLCCPPRNTCYVNKVCASLSHAYTLHPQQTPQIQATAPFTEDKPMPHPLYLLLTHSNVVKLKHLMSYHTSQIQAAAPILEDKARAGAFSPRYALGRLGRPQGMVRGWCHAVWCL